MSLASALDDCDAPSALDAKDKHHPFAAQSEDTYLYLHRIAQAADRAADSLTAYLALPWAQPKLISLLRQQSNLLATIRSSERRTKQFVDVLQERAGTIYSEDIPLDPATVANFCISRLEAWGVKAGMESFKDDGRAGDVTVMLGGKVLVVDVVFSITTTSTNNNETPSRPRARVASVKTSYASPDDASGTSSNTKGSISLDAFLAGSVQAYCDEVQKQEDERDAIRAAKLASHVLQQLRYLVMLDRLAELKDGARVAWFVDTDQLCPKVEAFARAEAEVVASALSAPTAPLDIFLLRSHALPLPYLSSPSITFLVYVSPLAYLSCLQSIPSPSPTSTSSTTGTTKLPNIDISLPHLRSYLSSSSSNPTTPSKGITTATLSVAALTSPPLFLPAEFLPGIATRPAFPFCSHGADIRHVFPRNNNATLPSSTAPASSTSSGIATATTTGNGNGNGGGAEHHVWMLDFTNGGQHPGVVMSQSQMRDIELLITPLGGLHTNLDDVGMISFGSSCSWVDLLLNPGTAVRHERYITLYTSPGNLHPPLQLRLTPPDEPGFILERVPVHNIQEVWGVLEIVREQSWLNETLLACQWVPEDMKPTDSQEEMDEDLAGVTDEELQAVLAGTNIPQKIPINISLDSPLTHEDTDTLFSIDPASPPTRRPKIIMRSPERPPITGLVEISVSLDETRPRGVAVEVHGAMGLDVGLMGGGVLEEICRRGGTFGIPGRVWAASQGMVM